MSTQTDWQLAFEREVARAVVALAKRVKELEREIERLKVENKRGTQ